MPIPTFEIRPVDELDVEEIVRIDEALGGGYRPEVWDRRVGYYLRRDPEASMVAEMEGRVIGFMLGEVRSGEFGLEEPTGWIEVMGVEPEQRGQGVGRLLAEAMLAHFRIQGARRVRTLVDEKMEGLTGFFASLGFESSALRAFEREI